MLLVGDIGGTNTRLALARQHQGSFSFEQMQIVPTGTDIGATVAAYLQQAGSPRLGGCAIGGAGPVQRSGGSSRIALTNADAVIDSVELAHIAGLGRAVVINDFAAVAYSLPLLRDSELQQVGGGGSDQASPRIAIGAGTGLGCASAVPSEQGWVVVDGEGGHIDLAPVDDEELHAWQLLRAQGRVSAERVLSGPGFAALHAALAGTPESPLQPAAVAQLAFSGDAMAATALRLFCGWLGRYAGNLALTFGARGGVYLAGGIVPTWGERFDRAAFRRGFEDKEPFAAALLAQVPVYIVTHPTPGLLGCAGLASRTQAWPS